MDMAVAFITGTDTGIMIHSFMDTDPVIFTVHSIALPVDFIMGVTIHTLILTADFTQV